MVFDVVRDGLFDVLLKGGTAGGVQVDGKGGDLFADRVQSFGLFRDGGAEILGVLELIGCIA